MSVEASQWFKHGDHPAVHCTAYDAIPGIKEAVTVPADHPYGYADTAHGRVLVSPGDWIVTGKSGEVLGVYSNARFTSRYEAIDVPHEGCGS